MSMKGLRAIPIGDVRKWSGRFLISSGIELPVKSVQASCEKLLQFLERRSYVCTVYWGLTSATQSSKKSCGICVVPILHDRQHQYAMV
jgi:hypothetical protein